MWYVIETTKGEEQRVCTWINQKADKTSFERCFVPLYEDVWRKEGIGHISIKTMFSGYVFIKTTEPQKIREALLKLPEFTDLLPSDGQGAAGRSEQICFPVGEAEETFLNTIFTDGVMRVSYIERNEEGKLISVIGPLAAYQDNIIKIDLPHRRAIAEIPFLGETRRIKFGLWADRDPQISWIEEEKRLRRGY